MSDLHSENGLSEEQKEAKRNRIRLLFRVYYHRLAEDKIFELPEGIEDDHIHSGFEREMPVNVDSLAEAFRRCLKSLPRGFVEAEIIDQRQGGVSWRLWHGTPQGKIGELGEFGTLEFSTMRDGFSGIFYSGISEDYRYILLRENILPQSDKQKQGGRYRLTDVDIKYRKEKRKEAARMKANDPALYWKEIAEKLDVPERTLRDWRHNPIYD